MAKILISPSKYVQGAGEMKKLYSYAKNYGKKALVLISASGYKRSGTTVESASRARTLSWYSITSTANARRARSFA